MRSLLGVSVRIAIFVAAEFVIAPLRRGCCALSTPACCWHRPGRHRARQLDEHRHHPRLVGADFLPSLLVEAVGLALSLTSLVTLRGGQHPAGPGAHHRRRDPERPCAGHRDRLGLHPDLCPGPGAGRLQPGGPAAQGRRRADRPEGDGAVGCVRRPGRHHRQFDRRGAALLGNLVRREAFVLAYVDAFWFIACLLTASLGLLVFLKPPPPNILTPAADPAGLGPVTR